MRVDEVAELMGISDHTHTDYAKAQPRAGAKRQNYDFWENIAPVPPRKSLLLKRKRRFAFRKTAALLATCIILGITAIAIDAIGTGSTEPQTPKPEPTLEASTMSTITPEPTTEKPKETTVPAATEKPEPTIPIYSIPLSEELQAYTYRTCEEYGVDYEMVLALMDKESSYRAGVISKSDDYGLMQINTINHETLKDALGITDFLDPEQNILCGVSFGKLTAKSTTRT
jgi:hypothetical protein